MSDSVKCECCGKSGRRPRMHPAPENWFFIESTIEDENDTLFVYACSEECKAGVWKKGPGERWTCEGVVMPRG
jgi:hypothetical protein